MLPLISKCSVDAGGRLPHDRRKHKTVFRDAAEIGKKARLTLNKKSNPRDEKLKVNLSERHFLGRCWRTGEAIFSRGINRAVTTRRVGAVR